MSNRCPWPNCQNEVKKDRVLCNDHYFSLPASDVRILNKLKARARRCDAENQKHLEEQIPGYARIMIKKHLEKKKEGKRV